MEKVKKILGTPRAASTSGPDAGGFPCRLAAGDGAAVSGQLRLAAQRFRRFAAADHRLSVRYPCGPAGHAAGAAVEDRRSGEYACAQLGRASCRERVLQYW